MHLQSQNYVEAGLTLKLHSDLYDWDLTKFLEPMPDLGLPRQSQFSRKETLCLLILDYLGRHRFAIFDHPFSKTWPMQLDLHRQRQSMGKCD